jgi:hypothetical protein
MEPEHSVAGGFMFIVVIVGGLACLLGSIALVVISGSRRKMPTSHR